MTPTPDREPIREGLARAMADENLWPGAFDSMRHPEPYGGATAEREVWLRSADACLTYLIKRQAFHSDAYAVIKKEGLGK